MNESLVQILFGKTIHELKLSDIAAYFDTEKPETDKLEYKSYVDFVLPNSTKPSRDKEKVADIFKSICAFLNSDGGILIWGAPIGIKSDGSTEKVFTGPLTRVDYKLEKDQFINRISGEISPTPHKILFHPISVDTTTFCYVIEVTKSDFAPHQFKGTYYMRLDGSTRIAPHHYVEALIKRVSFPKLETYLSFGDIITGREYSMLPFVFTIHNLSKNLNEKNLHYRIICDRGEIKKISDNLDNLELRGSDYASKAKDILHNRMPFYEEFVCVTKRLTHFSNPITVRLMLTVWGDSSPVIASIYNLEFWGDINVNTRFKVESQNENFYLHEQNDGSNDVKKSDSFLVKSLNERLYTFPIYRQLHQ
jgi:hypothetical protein